MGAKRFTFTIISVLCPHSIRTIFLLCCRSNF